MKLHKYTWGEEAYVGVIIGGYANNLATIQAVWAELSPHFPNTPSSEVKIEVSLMPGKCQLPALLFPTNGVAVPPDFYRIQSNAFYGLTDKTIALAILQAIADAWEQNQVKTVEIPDGLELSYSCVNLQQGSNHA